MKQKIFSIFLIFIFLFGFGYFFWDEYFSFRENQHSQRIYISQNNQNNTQFQLSDIQKISDEHTDFLVFPNLDLLEKIVSNIDMAQEKIFVEVYIFTEKEMRASLIRAKERGVEVKVILENNPYQAPYLNDTTYEELKNAGIDLVWSDPLKFSLNHSKLLIVDNSVYVSTWNFSYSLFKYNRDFMYYSQNSEILQVFESIFLSDFFGETFPKLTENIVLSPDNSRIKLQTLLQSAKKSIDFYFPYFSDEKIENILFSQADEGVRIRGITEKDFFEKNTDMMKKYREKVIEISPLKNLHGKAILVDDSYLYIGSENFSSYSLDENREMGILISDANIIQKFQNIFTKDFSEK